MLAASIVVVIGISVVQERKAERALWWIVAGVASVAWYELRKVRTR